MKTYELTVHKNIRDIGGLKVKDGRHIKYGRLYRGNVLRGLNEDDIEVVNNFHLTDIIDFRSLDESIEHPSYCPEGAIIHNLPVIREPTQEEMKNRIKEADGNLLWFVGDHTSGFEHLRKVYREFVTTDKGIIAFKKFFEIIMKDDVVVYFHCSQGKDRTGFAAYLLEIALGVSEEEAMEDYLYSNIAMEKRAERLLKKVEYRPFYNEQYKKDLLDVFSTKVEYMESAIEMMNEHYGGTMNFIIDALGVDIDRLKELYLE